jgi:hypothetical protein
MSDDFDGSKHHLKIEIVVITLGQIVDRIGVIQPQEGDAKTAAEVAVGNTAP